MLNGFKEQDEESNDDDDKQIYSKDLKKLNIFSNLDRKETGELK